MIVVDSSALVAILFRAPMADALLAAAARAAAALVSAGSLIETAMVVQARLGDAGEAELDALVERLRLDIVAVDKDQVMAAREGFRRFGKGRSPAGSNVGDLFACALARSRDLPLLYVGDGFGRTDVAAALEAPGRSHGTPPPWPPTLERSREGRAREGTAAHSPARKGVPSRPQGCAAPRLAAGREAGPRAVPARTLARPGADRASGRSALSGRVPRRAEEIAWKRLSVSAPSSPCSRSPHSWR